MSAASDILSYWYDRMSHFCRFTTTSPPHAVQIETTSNDDRRSPQVECGGWVRLRGLRSIGEDIVYLDDERTPPPLHAHVISPTSLLGRLLIGCRVGETVVFDAAGGRVTLTILDVGRSTPIGGVGRHGSGLPPSSQPKS